MTEKKKVLAINNGSTSTKLALYEDQELKAKKDVSIDPEIIKNSKDIMDQRELRTKLVLEFLRDEQIRIEEIDMVASQAGALPGIHSGGYYINELMCDVLARFPVFQHAANLGCIMAYDIACQAGCRAIIYDGNITDEMDPIAKITGIAGLKRIPTSHVLNTRSLARKLAAEMGKAYEECNFLMVHLGGGVSLNAQCHGRIIDDLFDDEGPMAPQRAGLIPACQLIPLCYSGKYTEAEMQKLIRGKGGLLALTGTQDAREIEKRIEEGDKTARDAYYAMAYQVAKGIGALSTVFDDEIDAIVLTGGMAHSEMLTGWICERVKKIAPVKIVPGEFEMDALAQGALRILNGEETAEEYDIIPENYVPIKK